MKDKYKKKYKGKKDDSSDDDDEKKNNKPYKKKDGKKKEFHKKKNGKTNIVDDATDNVVKIDIATSCDDLIVDSIEQGSSSKGKKMVESDNYDDYVKLKNENEKLKKDLEKLSTTNTIRATVKEFEASQGSPPGTIMLGGQRVSLEDAPEGTHVEEIEPQKDAEQHQEEAEQHLE
ncbi:uncharacterized protein [Miscanthus floridulus]|uniref:uncharacterized protein n=1 Tax=Miscanthus floridulus TaxID=154761 RepID=UPI003457A746